ncbi:MAG TPA: riboflavin synthase [Candidatus Kapabacteria bacterium]|nr:riboflavin synthase [Candidatus Kapabacteria bacterium]
MFTGLIEEVGTVADVTAHGGARRITVRTGVVTDGLAVDDSVALDGCCQTVVDRGDDWFTVVAVEETLKKTTLGAFTAGRRVNLERALRIGDRLGGHFVQGHVDCTGLVAGTDRLESSWIFWIEYPEEFASLVIPVGSIAINGVSLTAAEVHRNRCKVSIIPHTHAVTTFNALAAGDAVNVEFDMIGKYIRSFVAKDA